MQTDVSPAGQAAVVRPERGDTPARLRAGQPNAPSDQVAAAVSVFGPRDRDTLARARARDIAARSLAVAERLGLGMEERFEVRDVAMFHDVGEEFLRRAPSLRHLCPAVRSVRENWDGSGQPDGLAGSEIPQASRIVRVCAAFHAMTSAPRPRRTLRPEEAVVEIAAGAGAEFCPRSVMAFLSVMRPTLTFAEERWACLDCGTHATRPPGAPAAGQCPNCRSYNLAPLVVARKGADTPTP